MKKVLYLGWIGFKNLGDELLWELFKQHFDGRYHAESVELIPSKPGVPVNDMNLYDTVILGGGSLLVPGYVDLAHNALLAGKKVAIWGTGFDCLEQPAALNAKWLDEKTANKIAELVKGAFYFGVRGPLTYRVLEAAGIPLEGAIVSGDPGILLPVPSVPESETKRKIAINWGTTYNKLFGRDEIRVEDELAAAAREWSRQGYSLYLYPVWGPDRASLERLAGKIGTDADIEVEQKLLGTAPLTEKLAGCHFSVNFKLHANLLSYAADLPFITLGYRFKCFDFVQSVDLLDFIIPTDTPDLAASLRNSSAWLESERKNVIRKIRAHRQTYSPLLTIPFDRSLIV